jgi:transcriptional regulator with XRE-family HTH domain
VSREKDFAAWLKRQLDRREWTAAELARRIEVSPTSVSRWVNGREVPSSNNARRIADAFYLEQDDVLTLAGHRDQDRPISPDDPLSRLIRKLKRVTLNRDRENLLDQILDAYLETDRDSQDNLLVHAA